MIIFRRAVRSLFVALVLYFVGTDASRYCDISPEHTLCQYHGPGPACGPHLLATGVSLSDVAVILDTHNQLRSQLAQGLEQRGSPGPQPPAADMRMLQWDEELAAIAQMHALQCVFEHECNSCRRVDRWPVGQNLYISSANLFVSGNDWSGIIEDWYSEVEGFDGTSVEDYKYAQTTGHFTQMTWATTTKIGCGFSMFQDENGWFEKLYTCNYGPVGNSIDSPMYSIGSPCSMCPNEGCSYDYPGLCLGEPMGFVYPSDSIGNVQRQQFQEIQPHAVTLLTSRPTSDIRNILGTNPSSFGNFPRTVYSNPGTTYANLNNLVPSSNALEYYTTVHSPSRFRIEPSSSYQLQIEPAINGATPIQKIAAPHSYYSSKPIQTGGPNSFNIVKSQAYPRLVQQQNKFANPISKHRRRTPSGLHTRKFYGQPIWSKQLGNSPSRSLPSHFQNVDALLPLQQGDSYNVLNNRPGTIDRILLSTSKVSQDFGQHESNIGYPALLDSSLAAPSSGDNFGIPKRRTQQQNIRLPAWNTKGNNNIESLSSQLEDTNTLSRPTQYNNDYPPSFPQLIDPDSSSRQSQYGNYLSTLSTPQKGTNFVLSSSRDNYLSTLTQQQGSSDPSWQQLNDDYFSTLTNQQQGSSDPSWQTLDDDYFSTLTNQQQGSNDSPWQTLDDDYFSTLTNQQQGSNDSPWQTLEDDYFSALTNQQQGSNDSPWQTLDEDYFPTLTNQQQGYNDSPWPTLEDDYFSTIPNQQQVSSDPSWQTSDDDYFSTLATEQQGSSDPSWQFLDDNFSSILSTQQHGSNEPFSQTTDDNYLPSFLQQSDPSDPSWLSQDEEYIALLADHPGTSYHSTPTQYDNYLSTLSSQQTQSRNPYRQTQYGYPQSPYP